MEIKTGKKFTNKNGAVIEIVKKEEDYVLFSLNGKMQDCTPAGLENMLKFNNYEEINEKEIILKKDGVEYTAKIVSFKEVYLDGRHAREGLTYKGFTGKDYGRFYTNEHPIFENEQGELLVVVDDEQ